MMFIQSRQYRQIFINRIISCSEKDKYHDIYTKEIKRIEELLDDEPKNYHCWSYRTWLIDILCSDRIIDEELSRIHYFIKSDPWNNSVWSHRYSVIIRNSLSNVIDAAQAELEYLLQYLDIDNESIWNYSRGYVIYSNNAFIIVHSWLKYLSLEYRKEWFETIEQIYIKSSLDNNRFYLSLKLDMLKEDMDASISSQVCIFY